MSEISRNITAKRSPEQFEQQRDSLVLSDLAGAAQVLWARRWWICIAATVMICLSAIAISVFPAKFTASTAILLDPRSLQVDDKELTPRSSGNEMNLALVESQMRIMVSDNVLRAIVETEKLVDDPEFVPPPNTITTVLSAVRARRMPSQPSNSALRKLRSSVAIDREAGSYVISLSVTTSDAEKSARLANAVAAQYVESEFNSKTKLARRASASLGERLARIRGELQRAEEAVEEFIQQNNVIQFADQSGTGQFSRDNLIGGTRGRLLSELQLGRLSDEYLEARAAASQAEARHAQIQELRDSGAPVDSLAEPLSSDTIARLRERYSAAQQVEASLSQMLDRRHPRLVQARARTATARQSIEEEIDRIAASALSAYQRAKANEEQLAARVSALEQDNSQVNQKLVRLRELQREANARRVVYESYLVRSREIEEQENFDTSIARVLSPAIAPSQRSGPRASLILALSAAFGIAAGGIGALFREELAPIVRSASQVSRVTQLPVLSVVRELPASIYDPLEGSSDAAAKHHHSLKPVVPSGVSTLIAPGSGLDQLRELLFSGGGDGPGRSVIISAASKNAAKSSLALNLAVSISGSGIRTLLVDGDVARRTLSRAFVPTSCGAPSNFLDEAEASDQRVVVDQASGVHLFPAALKNNSQIGCIKASDMQRQLANFGKSYGAIVVDGGIVGQEFSARTFCEASDNIVLVARCGLTKLADLQIAIASLGELRSRLVGIALVDM